MRNTINPVIFGILGKTKDKKILDLACGNGWFSFFLEKQGTKVTGVDISSKLIIFAKETKKR